MPASSVDGDLNMANNQCPDCARQLPKGHTRCLYCDDLKYKAELELENESNDPVGNDGTSRRFSEIAENKRNRKAASKQARLDAAFAWGSSIGSNEIQQETSQVFVGDSYCSGCGVKFAKMSNFCPGCGKKRNGLAQEESFDNRLKPSKRKKTMSSILAMAFLLLAVAGIGYGIFINFAKTNSSSDVPQDYETSSDSNYDGMTQACDHLRIAISHHDPRYLASRDSQSDIDIYKNEMQLAADILREESNYNPNAYELTKIAQQMHDGYRGRDEYGHFPLMEYCGA